MYIKVKFTKEEMELWDFFWDKIGLSEKGYASLPKSMKTEDSEITTTHTADYSQFIISTKSEVFTRLLMKWGLQIIEFKPLLRKIDLKGIIKKMKDSGEDLVPPGTFDDREVSNNG